MRTFAIGLGAAAVMALITATAAWAEPAHVAEGTGIFYIDTSACPDLVTPQPGPHPFGATISGEGTYRITMQADPDPFIPWVWLWSTVRGTAVDTNTGDQYTFNFTAPRSGQYHPEYYGLGTLVFMKKGAGGGMIAYDAIFLIYDQLYLYPDSGTEVRCLP